VENIPGHRDHRSDDHDQLIGIIPERVIGSPGTLIGIVRNPQFFLGMHTCGTQELHSAVFYGM
jgi:hypothetical protein